jgi:hypothetical protein
MSVIGIPGARTADGTVRENQSPRARRADVPWVCRSAPPDAVRWVLKYLCVSTKPRSRTRPASSRFRSVDCLASRDSLVLREFSHPRNRGSRGARGRNHFYGEPLTIDCAPAPRSAILVSRRTPRREDSCGARSSQVRSGRSQNGRRRVHPLATAADRSSTS